MNIDEIIKTIKPDEDYTTKQVQEIFSVSQTALHNNIRSGKLKARKVFNKYYVKGSILRSFLLGE